MAKNNTGEDNTGDYNSGYCNSGDRNSGNYNSGNYNSGNCNSGNYNSGDRNSGCCNSGNYNSGWFNTDCPKMRIFNKEIDMTVEEFLNSKHAFYIELPVNRWINSDDMTDTEKSEVGGWETMGGYLKTLEYKEAWAVYWKEASKEKKQRFLDLPNFDSKLFEEITGIDVKVSDKETIKIGDLEFDKAEVEKRLKGLKPI